MDTLRIVVADDHPLFRMGLKYALKAQGFDVVAEAENGQLAIELCLRHQPKVALLDVKMPDLDGLEACRRIRAEAPSILVVMLTTFDEPAIVHAAREAGATAYLSKETEPEKLAQLLRNIVERPNASWLPRVKIPKLTVREMDVLMLLAQGSSNKAIAKRLGLSPETIKDHLNGVYRKLNVRDRVSAVRKANELGILQVG